MVIICVHRCFACQYIEKQKNKNRHLYKDLLHVGISCISYSQLEGCVTKTRTPKRKKEEILKDKSHAITVIWFTIVLQCGDTTCSLCTARRPAHKEVAVLIISVAVR